MLGIVVTFSVIFIMILHRGRVSIASTNSGNIESVSQVYDLLRSRHYFYEGDSDMLISGAIIGMIDVLDDPHSTYFTMTDYEDFVGRLEDSYSGIGCEVMSMNGYTIIVAPLPGSPAEEAGILANDTIIEINGENVVGESLQEVVNNIKGPLGTIVTLGIRRGDSTELINIEVKREEISQESVTHEMITESEKNIGYIQVLSFGENTYNEFVEAVELLEEAGMDSLIVNLRNNSGGYLTAVAQMLDYLLPGGEVIASVQNREGESEQMLTSGKTPGKEYPIVTLINEGSASALEIFAAAMKEAVEQEVVGMTSYGKGTVQETLQIDENALLKLTTQAWLTSAGNWVDEIGVEPTIEVDAPDFYSFYQVYLTDEVALEFDMVSPAVENAQNILSMLDYSISRHDGYFDQGTVEAVEDFQRDNGLKVTGVIDTQTANELTLALRDHIRNPEYDTQLQKAIELLSK